MLVDLVNGKEDKTKKKYDGLHLQSFKFLIFNVFLVTACRAILAK